jgi:lysozyme
MTKLQAIRAAVVGAVAISAAGTAFVAGWEGRENKPYRDIVGVWTVCYGSTGAHVVPNGAPLSNAECTTLLREDLQRFEAAVNRCTPAFKTQNQFDALTSLSFNIGERAYCSSTLARKFNAGDTLGAANQFPRWSYAGGREVRGLRRRREAERTLFLRPDSPSPPVYVQASR